MDEQVTNGASPYIDVGDVARRLHLSTRSVYELARTNAIPHRHLPGMRRLLFRVDELDQWEAGAELEVINPPGGGRVVRPSGTPRFDSREAATS